MHYIKLTLITLLLAATAATAQAQKSKKAKTNKKGSKTELTATPSLADKLTRPDTVSVDSFSYALGMSQAFNIHGYLIGELGMDTAYMADFERGYQAYMATNGTQDKELTAYVAGVRVGSLIRDNVLKNMNYQITGKENTSFVSLPQLSRGFLDGTMRRFDKLHADTATAIVRRQGEYYEALKAKVAADYMLDNLKSNPDLRTLEGGVQYRILTKGSGAQPTDTSTVKVNYEGRLINGEVFDSSYKRGEPTSFKLNQVIKGWQTALKAMPAGSTWEIFIPQELAYGFRGNKGIPPYSPLIFKVELISFE